MIVKIISQSTVAHRPVYFHLAYLAATHTVPSRGLLGGGTLALLLGCALALRFARRNPTGKGRGQIALVLRNENPRLRLWGLVSLAAGTVIVFLGFKAGETRYIHPESHTRASMHVLASYIGSHLTEGEPIPEDTAALATQWKLPKSQIQDGWSNEMRLMKTTAEEGMEYRLVSAGKDKKFGTGDDLVQTIPYPQKAPEARI